MGNQFATPCMSATAVLAAAALFSSASLSSSPLSFYRGVVASPAFLPLHVAGRYGNLSHRVPVASFASTAVVASNMTPPSANTGLEVTKIPSEKLYVSEPDPQWFGNGENEPHNKNWTNENWLKSRFHFSFAEYRNSGNFDFGAMRVMNDDLVQPFRGFGAHPHRDMEIITYVVEGQLTHEDSMGTSESLGRGSIQFMTAGTGVVHSEFNHHDKPLRFIQTWIKPSSAGLKPNYGSHTTSLEERSNKLHHLVSGEWSPNMAPVRVKQDVDAYVSEIDLDKTVTLEMEPDRMAYVLCIEGGVSLNHGATMLQKYDGAEISASSGGTLSIKATAVESVEGTKQPKAHVLVYIMKAVPGAGRKDL